MTKLYELASPSAALERMADDKITTDEQLEQWIAECGDALQDKAVNIGMLVGNLDALAASIKEAEIRMAARRKVVENRIASIKKCLLSGMQAAGIMKIECPYFKISIKKNPPSLVIDDESKISMSYWRQKPPPDPEIDKNALKEDILKHGLVVEGAHVEHGERLEIK